MDFLCLDGMRRLSRVIDFVLNGELDKRKAVCHDDVLCWFFSEEMMWGRDREC